MAEHSDGPPPRGIAARLASRSGARFALVALAAGGLAAGLAARGAPARRAAPALPARVLSGPPVTIADLRGRPAALVFWATWCNPCRAEAGAVEAVARAVAGHARVVGIDYSDSGDWRGFVRAHGWTFPVLADPNGATLDAYGITVGIPATVIVDSGGRIAAIRYGAQRAPALRAALAAAG